MAKSNEDPGASIAERVRGYIDQRPVVRDALAMEIVNLSALTRRIQEDLGVQKREAVLAACRRYDPPKAGAAYEEGIRRVLSKSKLEVRTHVAVVTTRPSWRTMAKLEEAMNQLRGRDVPLHVLQGSESFTIITDEGFHDQLVELLGKDEVLRTRVGLVEVNVRSPDVIEDVPGILSFLTSSLSERGVNFIDVISCHKDNIFVIEEGDLFPTFETLNQLIGG